MSFRMDQGIRARRVITRSPTRTVGRFPSAKSRRSVHWESQLERDFICLLEFDPAILEYREQPETISLKLDGVIRRYPPDFLVRTAAGYGVYEVKPGDKVAHPDIAPVLARAAEHYAARGMGYQVVTEAEIRRRPYLDNVRLLLRYQAHPVEADIMAGVIGCLERSPLSVGQVLEHLAPTAGLAELYAMLATHQLKADLSLSLGSDSLIHLPDGG